MENTLVVHLYGSVGKIAPRLFIFDFLDLRSVQSVPHASLSAMLANPEVNDS